MKTTKKPGPSKGTRPNFNGVPGCIVASDALPEGLDFAAKRARISPYDGLLEKLLEAPKNSALKFGDLRARASIIIRARKKGLRVVFAERGSELYVRIDGFIDSNDKAKATLKNAAPATLPSKPSDQIEQAVLRAMAVGFSNPQTIADHARKNGTIIIGVAPIQSALIRMEINGLVRRDGSQWKMNDRASLVGAAQ